jgi:hypothetical protein
MDIDDILRETDPNFDTAPRGNRDLQALTRAWVAERSAPELLEYARDLVLIPKKGTLIDGLDGQQTVSLNA